MPCLAYAEAPLHQENLFPSKLPFCLPRKDFEKFDVANKVEEEYASTSVSAQEQGDIVAD